MVGLTKQHDDSKKDTVKNGHKPMNKRNIFAFTRIHQTLFNPYSPYFQQIIC